MQLLLTLLLSAAAGLTLPEARRATDRAFRTEIAGDHEGAIRALRELLADSVDPAEAPARAHLEGFLSGLRARRAALEDGAEARAMATLRDAPAAWRALYWSALKARHPGVCERLETTRLALRFGRVAGFDPEEALERVAVALQAQGLAVVQEDETHRLRLDLDASEKSEVRHRTRAQAEGSFVLTEVGAGKPPRSGFLEIVSERKDPGRAQRLAERRLIGGLADEVGFELRLWALSLSPPADESSPR